MLTLFRTKGLGLFQSRKAFTMIELLIGLVIGAMISFVVMNTLTVSLSSFYEVNMQTSMDDMSEKMFRAMKDEISQSNYISISNTKNQTATDDMVVSLVSDGFSKNIVYSGDIDNGRLVIKTIASGSHEKVIYDNSNSAARIKISNIQFEQSTLSSKFIKIKLELKYFKAGYSKEKLTKTYVLEVSTSC